MADERMPPQKPTEDELHRWIYNQLRTFLRDYYNIQNHTKFAYIVEHARSEVPIQLDYRKDTLAEIVYAIKIRGRPDMKAEAFIRMTATQLSDAIQIAAILIRPRHEEWFCRPPRAWSIGVCLWSIKCSGQWLIKLNSQRNTLPR